jgi:hypothetical protein
LAGRCRLVAGPVGRWTLWTLVAAGAGCRLAHPNGRRTQGAQACKRKFRLIERRRKRAQKALAEAAKRLDAVDRGDGPWSLRQGLGQAMPAR